LFKKNYLHGRRVFQIGAVELRDFGNQVQRQAVSPPLSHAFQRPLKKACAKPMICVKSASGAARGKRLQRTGYAQLAGLPQL
jgi:hypothetical protein